MSTTIGSHIAQRRWAQNLTRKNRCLSNKTISKWNIGKCMPDYRMNQTLCDALHVTIPELMDGEDAAKNREQKLIFGLLMGLSIVDIIAVQNLTAANFT